MTKLSKDKLISQRAATLGVMFLAVLTGLLAVSSQSLWIDEGNAAIKAIQESWHSFLSLLIKEKGSDLQMPGYMAMLWAWAKIFGQTEYALRAMNIPWYLLGIGAVLYFLRLPFSVRMGMAAFLLLSPFCWFYLDEARPYAMQIGTASLTVCALYNILFDYEQERLATDLGAFFLGTFLLSVSSLFAMVLVFPFYLILLMGIVFRPSLRTSLMNKSKSVFLICIFALFFSLLAWYYFWTLFEGARASGVGGTNLKNLLFIFYEMLGFNGLGPDRLSIRKSFVSAFFPYLPVLLLGFAAYAMLGLGTILRLKSTNYIPLKPVSTLAMLFFGGVLIGYAVGHYGDFRLLGRHLTPLFPILALGVGAMISLLWKDKRGRILAIFFLCILLASSISGRYHPRFAKDDYKNASAIALMSASQGNTVWWAADPATAVYYGFSIPDKKRIMNIRSNGDILQIRHVAGETITTLENKSLPDMVIISKPDLYDSSGHIHNFLKINEFDHWKSLSAFRIYKRVEREDAASKFSE